MYDTRADVYSWGVLLAELLAQKPPYESMYLTPVQVRCRGRRALRPRSALQALQAAGPP